MKPKIAVVCAYNPGNSGMYSVDLAAVDFFSSIDCEFNLFMTQSPMRGIGTLKKYIPTRFLQLKKVKIGTMTFRLLKDLEQLNGYSHIVYWGDFINNPVYGKHDFSVRDVFFGISETETEAFQRWIKLFAPENLNPNIKIASIGNNFQHKFDIEDTDTNSVFNTFERNFDLILPRDSYSLDNLRQFLPNLPPSKLDAGIDCAFLLHKNQAAKKMNQFACLFKRTQLDDIGSLIEGLNRHTGLSSTRLDNWLSLKRHSADKMFNTNIETVACSTFVLTDTYHVCVNAMRLGVPVFAIGRKSKNQEGTVGDFKKKTLFEMFNASQFYFTIDENEDEYEFYQNVIEKIHEFISSPTNIYDEIQDSMSRQQVSFKEKIIKFIEN